MSALIPNEQNTSLFVTNLPPVCTVAMLLSSIRGCGKVYFTHINAPDERHATSAARITFWHRQGVNRLLEQVDAGTFVVDGYVPSICLNRWQVLAQPSSDQSQVVIINEPVAIVNHALLETTVFTGFFYNLEAIIVRSSDNE
ncbi:hypothetical protein F4779DRAFT_613054 [Xylariaceae sp. FL0662B]|nr:hypothetical protein F4779DRAFT_613054 [Xylariaceae sp. FL0662B]